MVTLSPKWSKEDRDRERTERGIRKSFRLPVPLNEVAVGREIDSGLWVSLSHHVSSLHDLFLRDLIFFRR